jgi:hypothetical protein
MHKGPEAYPSSCTIGTKLLSPRENRPRRRDINVPQFCACLARNGTVLLLWKVSKAIILNRNGISFRGVDVDL